jgi:hypothetical protein
VIGSDSRSWSPTRSVVQFASEETALSARSARNPKSSPVSSTLSGTGGTAFAATRAGIRSVDFIRSCSMSPRALVDATVLSDGSIPEFAPDPRRQLCHPHWGVAPVRWTANCFRERHRTERSPFEQ